MQNLGQYSEGQFIAESPTGQNINLLISGTLISGAQEISTYDSQNNEWVFNTGSWTFGNEPTVVSLVEGSILGVTIAVQDLQGSSNLNNFRVCESMSLQIKLGSTLDSKYLLHIEDKSIQGDYMYFRVVPVHFSSSVDNIKIRFISSSVDGNDVKYEKYSCEVDAPEVELLLEPFTSEIETSVFNPIFNNIAVSVRGTLARDVEEVTDESISTLKATNYSEISDYFFTSVANQLGRAIGSKNGYTTSYTGDKQAFVYENLRVAASSVEQGVIPWVVKTAESKSTISMETKSIVETGIDRPFFTVQGFTGSVYPLDTEIDTIKAINISDMDMNVLGFVPKAIFVSKSADSLEGSYIKVGSPISSSIPVERDIILNSNTNASYRITEKNIYIKELGKVATTDKLGHIVSIV